MDSDERKVMTGVRDAILQAMKHIDDSFDYEIIDEEVVLAESCLKEALQLILKVLPPT